MPDGTAADDSPDEGAWPEFEVDEQYREPEDQTQFDAEPDPPEAPDPSESEVDPDLRWRFWALVVLFNVALLAAALGLLFALFEGDLALGGQLFVAGAVVFAFGLYRYRKTKARLGERNW